MLSFGWTTKKDKKEILEQKDRGRKGCIGVWYFHFASLLNDCIRYLFELSVGGKVAQVCRDGWIGNRSWMKMIPGCIAAYIRKRSIGRLEIGIGHCVCMYDTSVGVQAHPSWTDELRTSGGGGGGVVNRVSEY